MRVKSSIWLIPFLYLSFLTNLMAQVYLTPLIGADIGIFQPKDIYSRETNYTAKDEIAISPRIGLSGRIRFNQHFGIQLACTYDIYKRVLGVADWSRIPNLPDDYSAVIGFTHSFLAGYIGSSFFLKKQFIFSGSFLLGRNYSNVVRDYLGDRGPQSNLYSGYSFGVTYLFNRFQIELSFSDPIWSTSTKHYGAYGFNSLGLSFGYMFKTWKSLKIGKSVECPIF